MENSTVTYLDHELVKITEDANCIFYLCKHCSIILNFPNKNLLKDGDDMNIYLGDVNHPDFNSKILSCKEYQIKRLLE